MSDKKNLGHNSKKDFLKNPVEHIDITSFDSRKIISSMEKMSFVSRETANAANIYSEMIKDKDCTIFLTLAGSTSAAGCMNIYKDLVKYNMVDAIVATGASIIDMDFFEALGFKHYQSKRSGLFMIGGGVPKNFIQDTVICAELLGKEVGMHKYAVQITVADSRDGACSSSTLKEASSWGKVDITKEQMVFAEATSVLPLIASDVYHKGDWKKRNRKNFSKIFG